MKKNYLLLFIMAVALFTVSCEKETTTNDDSTTDTDTDDEDEDEDEDEPTTAILILHEGSYGSSNASLSTIDSEGTLTNNVFATVNGIPIGDVGQSLTYIDGKYYIAVNNSAKIQVIDSETFELEATIDLSADGEYFVPYYICDLGNGTAVVSSEAYDWSTYTSKGTLAIIDLSTNTVTEKIVVSDYDGGKSIIVAGDRLFVDASYNLGVLSYDINDLTADPISVGADFSGNPVMVTDADGMVWGLGYSELICIDPATSTVAKTIALDYNNVAVDDYTARLAIDGDGNNLYFIAYNESLYSYDATTDTWSTNYDAQASVFTANISSTTTVDSPIFIPSTVSAYNLAVSPDNGNIYIADAVDYSQSGYVYEYDLTGEEQTKYEVSVCPQFIHFTSNNVSE